MSREQRLNTFLDAYCKEQHIMGVLQVTRRDIPLFQYRSGYGNLENRTAFHGNSVFSLYSITKPFCAIGLLKLADLGLVDIDRHPGIYLPEMKNTDPQLTLRHMLHHISGLPDFWQTSDFKNRHPQAPVSQVREHLKEILEYPPYFAPGTGAKYGNINFLPLALIIEHITGTTYAEYMQKEVFGPLGAKTLRVDREDLVLENRVQGYDLAEGQLVPVERNLKWMFGAGDLVGTVDDVYCLNKAIKHKLLLKPETWQEVLTPSPLNDMGLGCRVNHWHGKLRITHNGGSSGFRTMHMQLPEDDFDIIFLSNSGFGDARNHIAEAVYKACYGTPEGTDIPLEMDKGYV